MIERFDYESEEFQRELHVSPHHAGEVYFLQSIATAGMRVMEIGANAGVTAVALARAIGDSGHLYAFEPVPEYYDMLKENFSRNDVWNASAYRLALGARTERVPFYKREGSSGVTPAKGGETLWVEASTVSEFLSVQGIGAIHLLNMDCEGSEFLVLQGAEAVLKSQTPQIFCEVHPAFLKEIGQSVDELIEYLSRLGYDVRPLQVKDLGAQVSVDECSHIYASMPAADRPAVGVSVCSELMKTQTS